MTAIVCTYLLLTSTYCLALSEVWIILLLLRALQCDHSKAYTSGSLPSLSCSSLSNLTCASKLLISYVTLTLACDLCMNSHNLVGCRLGSNMWRQATQVIVYVQSLWH